MDEVFGSKNFIILIAFKKTGGQASTYLSGTCDYLLMYAKEKSKTKYNQLFQSKEVGDNSAGRFYKWTEEFDGSRRKITNEEIEAPHKIKGKIFLPDNLTSEGKGSSTFEYEFEGRKFFCGSNNHWKTNFNGLEVLKSRKRLIAVSTSLYYVRYLEDFPVTPIDNLWNDTVAGGYSGKKVYAVQTNIKVIERCILMATNPGDIVLDITCGSGTTAYVAERWGRRWITCDTSRVATTLAKQRLMTANFDYYKLAHPNEGVGSGFEYKTVPHITLKSIANNEPPSTETLYDQPFVDNKKTRITGPFTVEAVPAPGVKSFEEFHPLSPPPAGDTNVPLTEGDSGEGVAADTSIARTGETLRQSEWRDELLRTGVRAKGGNIIQFTRVEPMAGTKYIQAEAETKPTPDPSGGGEKVQRVLVVFGPEHAPLEQRMVENAWQEARALKPDMLLFCAFQFDEEAAKDIDELTPAIAGMQLLKAQMNADLLTDDLRKKRSSNESFWLVGQPDIEIHKLKESKVQVEVMGFDYYNPKTGNVESGGKKNIAMWMLDTDYDNRSLFPSQVFFPMAGSGDGWDKLARNLKAEIDEEKIESFRGTISLPFKPGSAVAVKIIDDRGIESLRVINL
ncbi:MAG: DNA methyltransferase [Candidatus Kuenenia sp.]|nr:DNA methyltransferase [Candidatus Kuenenia sp.]